MKNKSKIKKSLETHVSNLILIIIVCGMFFLAFTSNIKTVFNAEKIEAIYRGNINNNNKISLMINVYWGTEFIEPILEVLKEENIKVTFFVGGTWVAQNNELLEKMHNEGHEIGNHGYYHKDHKLLTSERNQEEIFITHKLVKEIIGVDMKLFAPPSGSYNQTTLQIANNLGYKTIMWSKDTIDWRDKDSELCYSRATKNAKSGELILMHPTEHTLKALPNIINYYKENNFTITTVSDNIS
ncbi:MAG: polysaccharide deacetylase [Clostridiales bacterium]|nr:polysaccharide deacetylase [Clostridiales bacterium]